jgi:hypothetical protein
MINSKQLHALTPNSWISVQLLCPILMALYELPNERVAKQGYALRWSRGHCKLLSVAILNGHASLYMRTIVPKLNALWNYNQVSPWQLTEKIKFTLEWSCWGFPRSLYAVYFNDCWINRPNTKEYIKTQFILLSLFFLFKCGPVCNNMGEKLLYPSGGFFIYTFLCTFRRHNSNLAKPIISCI